MKKNEIKKIECIERKYSNGTTEYQYIIWEFDDRAYTYFYQEKKNAKFVVEYHNRWRKEFLADICRIGCPTYWNYKNCLSM